MRGVLYDLGDYPGTRLDPSSERKVIGWVYQLPEDAGVLRELDGYEGFNPEAPEQSLFLRVEELVEMIDGRTLRCWIYVHNLEPVGGGIVESGRYKGVAS